MKTLRFLTVLFFSLSFIACSNNDDDDNTPLTTHEKIMGKWFMQSADGIATDDCEKQTFINFISNTNLILEVHYFEDNTCINDGANTYQYSINSNDDIAITGTGEDESDTLHVVSVTDTKLTVTSMARNNITLIFVKGK